MVGIPRGAGHPCSLARVGVSPRAPLPFPDPSHVFPGRKQPAGRGLGPRRAPASGVRAGSAVGPWAPSAHRLSSPTPFVQEEGAAWLPDQSRSCSPWHRARVARLRLPLCGRPLPPRMRGWGGGGWSRASPERQNVLPRGRAAGPRWKPNFRSTWVARREQEAPLGTRCRGRWG